MSLTYVTRPISDRSWIRTPAQREWSRFDTAWSKTLKDLEREIDMLRGRNVVIEVDVRERDIRLDGMLRADARASSPAVVIAFESKHGPLMYRCDRFTRRYSDQGPDWQHNARAIALTLESLRAVDRYGATNTGQQYAGWKQLEASAAVITAAPWTVLEELASTGVADVGEERVISLARRNAHPDHGGTSETWARFDAAYKAVQR
ncbi:hypothetical protein [Knoellia sp. LjRoot47]|uniref:hypothetical protein n=1 Tax=Knoellia sp. LjRoot47 TaxID=3342330 RepID=UPI003ECCE058